MQSNQGAEVQNHSTHIENKVKNNFFPIETHELKKFLPTAAMIFITVFSVHLLRNIKETLITYAPGSGAEAISFLKIYVVLPASILVSTAYMALRRKNGFKRSYYIIVGIFVSIFLLFGLVLYPNAELIHPSADLIQQWQQNSGLKWFYALWGSWSFALFYVCAELWGTYALNVLFWQFANNTTSPQEAKRFFPLYVLSGNVALLGLFPVISFLANHKDIAIQTACMISSISALLLLAIFYHINNHTVVKDIEEKSIEQEKKKKKLSFSESLTFLAQSKYIGQIAILVLAYGIIINLVEAVWKAELRSFYTDPSGFLNFMRYYTLYTGVSAVFMNYFGRNIIAKRGWIVGAMITPVVSGICSSTYFVFVLNKSVLTGFMIGLGESMLYLSVWFGAFNVLLSKSAKYSFFDPAKEMAFVPLDKELSTNGKAAVDGVCGRLGKSAGGLIVSTLLMLTGQNLITLVPIIAMVVVGFTLIWIKAVYKLNRLHSNQIHHNQTTSIQNTKQPEILPANA